MGRGVKVCYVASSAPLYRELAEAVADAGHEVSFIVFHDARLGADRQLPASPRVDVREVPWALKWNLPAVARRLRHALREVSPDLLHAHYLFPYGIHGALAMADAFVTSLHGTDAYYDAWREHSELPARLDAVGLGRPLFVGTHRALRMVADRIVVGSPDLEEAAVRLGYDPGRVRLCDLGVDPERFHAGLRDDALRAELQSTFQGGPVLISTRGFLPVYGTQDLLLAFRHVLDRFPDAILALAGGGPRESVIRDETRRLDLSRNVRFLGRIPHADIGRYMASSDVLCSAAYADTTSLSVLEGMACGLPVVATRVGSIPARLQSSRGGMLVEPGDVEGIAQALINLLEDPAMRESMGRRNAAFVRSALLFSDTVRKHLAVYEEVLSAR